MTFRVRCQNQAIKMKDHHAVPIKDHKKVTKMREVHLATREKYQLISTSSSNGTKTLKIIQIEPFCFSV
jgi:hypothetical protein